MFRQMRKLIELLNEFGVRDLVEQKGEIYKFTTNGDIDYTNNIISKKFGFIKWLVENEKIAYDIPNNSDLHKCFELACIPLDHTDYITMLLSIQDEPIEFLVSILK